MNCKAARGRAQNESIKKHVYLPIINLHTGHGSTIYEGALRELQEFPVLERECCPRR